MPHSTRKIAVSLIALIVLVSLFATLSAAAQGGPEVTIINAAVDESAHPNVVGDALAHRADHRARRRLSEAELIRIGREPGTTR